MEILNCQLCHDTGFIPIEREGYMFASYCDCKTSEYNTNSLEILVEKIPLLVRRNLSFRKVDGVYRFCNDFVMRPEQTDADGKFKNNLWISGESRLGKTHLVAERIIQIARKSKKVLSMDWMEAKDFDDLLLLQYGEQSDKLEYSRRKNRMAKLDILVLNDWDKIGKGPDKKYSVFKSNEIKDFADNVFPEIKVFIVTANSTMEKFMGAFLDQEVAATIWSRFSEDLTPTEIKI